MHTNLMSTYNISVEAINLYLEEVHTAENTHLNAQTDARNYTVEDLTGRTTNLRNLGTSGLSNGRERLKVHAHT